MKSTDGLPWPPERLRRALDWLWPPSHELRPFPEPIGEPGAPARSQAWLPEGTTIAVDAAAVRRPGGVLVGGAPVRVVRLSTEGAALLDRLAVGESVPASSPAQRMVRRLLDAGLAHPRPRRHAVDSGRVTAVVPVRDDGEGLAATVNALRAGGLGGTASSGGGTVVVDDGSKDPVSMLLSTERATVLGHAVARGPAAARNTGWRVASTDLVAFVDAGCLPPEGWLDELIPFLDDPAVAAVAPRIVPIRAPETPSWLAAYESCRSALDLGSREAPVRPRSWVPYVPTATLIVRRSALESIGGFDEALRTGEDVDLVWRLHAAGWRIRYQPQVTVAHPVRTSLGGWARQRFGYGQSAAPLARRHGDAVAPLDVSPWSAAAWGLAGTGHLLVGQAVAAGSVAALVRRVPGADSPDAGQDVAAELARLASMGHLRSGEALAAAVTRSWWPLAVVGAVASPRVRRGLGATAVLPPVVNWLRNRPDLDLARWTALHLADDVAYGAGVWIGCWRERSITALLPAARRSASDAQERRNVTRSAARPV